MKFALIDKRIIIVIAFYLVLATVFLSLIDWGISTAIDKSKIISLNKQAEGGFVMQKSKYQSLKQQTETLKKETGLKQSLRYPSLQDLKQQATKHNLTLRNIEKGSQNLQNRSETIKYLTSFVGQMTSQVNFLKEIESNYLFEADGLVVKAADEKGEKIVMTISLLVSE